MVDAKETAHTNSRKVVHLPHLVAKKPLEAFPAVFRKWSGRRDSNSRRPPWQGGALPTELRPQNREPEVSDPPRPSTAILSVSRPATAAGRGRFGRGGSLVAYRLAAFCLPPLTLPPQSSLQSSTSSSGHCAIFRCSVRRLMPMISAAFVRLPRVLINASRSRRFSFSSIESEPAPLTSVP